MKLLYTITSSIVLAVSATTASAECCQKDKAACTNCEEAKCDDTKCEDTKCEDAKCEDTKCEEAKCAKTECKDGDKCDAEAKTAAKENAAMTKFAVTGMTCKACSGKITKALEGIEGVTVKKVCHKSGSVAVNIDEKKTNNAAVQAAIVTTGFKVVGEKLEVPVSGMTCGSCSKKVTTAVKALDGVSSCSVCHKSGHASITVDTAKTSKAAVMEAINATGFKTAVE